MLTWPALYLLNPLPRALTLETSEQHFLLQAVWSMNVREEGRQGDTCPCSWLVGDCCFSTGANLEREFANRGVHSIGDSRSLGDRTAGVSSKDANEVWKRNVTGLNIRLVLQSKHVRTRNSLLACNSVFPLACVRSWVQSPALKEKKMGGWAKKN